jgi:hypothetical protein
MTLLGRVFVVVIFFISILTGGLILMVFVTRTNWKVERDKVQRQLAVTTADRDTWKSRVDEVQKERDAALVKKDEELRGVRNTLDGTRKELTDAQVKLQQEVARAQSADLQKGSTTEELKRREGEVRQLHDALAARDQRINAFVKENKDLRDKAVAMEIAFKSAQDRNEMLRDQLEVVSKDSERARIQNSNLGAPNGATPTAAKNPPPEDLHGVVKATDPDTGLVTISLGSDAGLSKGHTLEAYRLNPRPTYLGTLRILDVRHNESVGKLINTQRRSVLQKGDEVATDIVGRR